MAGEKTGEEITRKRVLGPSRLTLHLLVIIAVMAFIGGVVFAPMGTGIKRAPQSAAMQTCHTLGLALFQFANDHDNRLPEGKSSTEIFQQLIDGKYVSDPRIF